MSLHPQPHTAYVYDRGGKTRLFALGTFVSLDYERRRDDTSEAHINLRMASGDSRLEMLGTLRGGRHELVIYRGPHRVWEGPITRLTYRGVVVQIEAKDITHYLARTVMKVAYDNSGALATTVNHRMETIYETELARMEGLSPPINVLPHIDIRHFANDARTARKTTGSERTVFEELDGYAHRGGIDYTVVGRSLVQFDTHRNIGQGPQLTEADFMGDVIVSEYAMDLATEVTVTDGEGNFASTPVVADSYYGRVEMLFTAYDESDGEDPPTKAEMLSQANRNLKGRNPAPLEVRVPDGSRLSPASALNFEHLVPGVRFALRATLGGRRMSQMQKLDTVKVVVDTAGEQIMVTLSPASSDDEEL